jgi:hypothetical protein
VTDFDSKTEFLANWFKRSVVVVLPVNSTAGVYLNFIATFSPSIGMKKGVEVGGVIVGGRKIGINTVEAYLMMRSRPVPRMDSEPGIVIQSPGFTNHARISSSRI